MEITHGDNLMIYKKMPIILLVFLMLSGAQAATTNYNELGRKGYASWRCSVFAGMMQDTPETERLFKMGQNLLTIFVTDIIAGKVKKEDTKKVPVGILFHLISGPSVDFRLGFLWSRILDDARDKVDPKFRLDDKDRKLNAQSEYTKENCSLIK